MPEIDLTRPTNFQLTPRQQQARKMLSQGMYSMLFGGSRSGKTFLLLRCMIVRALKAPGSRHAALRFRFNHAKQSLALDTYPKVMRLCFPDVSAAIDKSDWYAKFSNGSEIWFGGLDDKQRTEKILGTEFSTLYLNECSQINWPSVEIVKTRLAQKVLVDMEGRNPINLPLRMWFDCNPPPKSHWTYRLFIEKMDPEHREPLSDPENYCSMQMNPDHNLVNLADGYLEQLQGLSSRNRKRFLMGEFADATPNQLILEEDIDKWRRDDTDKLPDFIRMVVGVDPSGADDEENAHNDAIGIIVGALGTDGNAYILEDCTVKAGPGVWGRVATSAWERHRGDCIVAEENFGGAMVKQTIKVANPRVPYKKITASRGKAQRVEPFAALYEQGKVRHVGRFQELEDELCAFSTFGYTGANSPNRADALIWVLAELFSGLTRDKPKSKVVEVPRYADTGGNGLGWMG